MLDFKDIDTGKTKKETEVEVLTSQLNASITRVDELEATQAQLLYQLMMKGSI